MLACRSIQRGACSSLVWRRPAVRLFATEAETAQVTPSPCPTSSSDVDEPTTRPLKRSRASLHTAIILNRSPFLTRTPTPFERAFYAYQARIHRALHNPFPYDFYFKQGSPLETRFNIEERRRERRAFGAPFGTVKLEERDEATELMEMSMRDEADESMPRIHEADSQRKGQRNLYAMLRTNENGKDVWRLPTGPVGKGELLHVSAIRRLEDECGRNMDTWLVSRNPIGVYHPPKLNDVVFFYKAHILAGQVWPKQSRYQDFAWLTKGEIRRITDDEYWNGIRDMLSDF
ncbi:39S mitochondrial ribosomal protein L46-domain-containing protein [Pisolithus sp. B1]|nr:39S mitochondrial ribosomal protein L46-domain-containing protein [Pisolithus sp. B1]